MCKTQSNTEARLIKFSQLPSWAKELIKTRRKGSVMQVSKPDGNLSVRPDRITFDGKTVVEIET